MVVVELYCKKDSDFIYEQYLNPIEDLPLDGLVYQVISKGHANDGVCGLDLSCAAISSVLMSFAGAIVGHSAIDSELSSEGRGHLILTIKSVPSEYKVWLAGLESGLVYGLTRIKNEFPRTIEIIVHQDKLKI